MDGGLALAWVAFVMIFAIAAWWKTEGRDIWHRMRYGAKWRDRLWAMQMEKDRVFLREQWKTWARNRLQRTRWRRFLRRVGLPGLAKGNQQAEFRGLEVRRPAWRLSRRHKS